LTVQLENHMKPDWSISVVERMTKIITLTTTIIAVTAMNSMPACAEPDQQTSRIISQLKANETNLSSQENNNHKGQIALLRLQLDEMRDRYATDVELNAEGITSANKMKISRAAYERVQVQLAAKLNKIDQTLSAIKRQRAVAQAMLDQHGELITN